MLTGIVLDSIGMVYVQVSRNTNVPWQTRSNDMLGVYKTKKLMRQKAISQGGEWG